MVVVAVEDVLAAAAAAAAALTFVVSGATAARAIASNELRPRPPLMTYSSVAECTPPVVSTAFQCEVPVRK